MKLLNNWTIIDQINWAEHSSTHRYYNTAKVELMTMYNAETMKNFSDFVSRKRNELEKHLDQYAGQRGKRIPGNYGGDDSFSDMLNHVIGCGEAYYNSVMEDPTLLENLDFVESFSYCIPYESDYEYLSSDYHRDAARDAVKKLARIAAENEPSAEDLETIKDIMARMLYMIAGNFAEATRGYPDSTYKRYYQFAANDEHALFANIISDCKKFMG